MSPRLIGNLPTNETEPRAAASKGLTESIDDGGAVR